MLFSPQIYNIIDQIGTPFIDLDEISQALSCQPTIEQVDQVIARSMMHHRLSLAQTAILLNSPDQDRVLKAASILKQKVYGNRIVLFAPLYVGNLCTNHCDYCSFAANNTQTSRKTLDQQELETEVDALAGQGHKRLILVYGEHPKYDAQFIADNVRRVYQTNKIRRVNINAAPLTVDGFGTVAQSGIGTYQVFQETYNKAIYTKHHIAGQKANFDWRLTAFDRAMEAGIDDVGLGVLLGLNPDWKEEIVALIRHTNHLEACFNVGPHTISFPRMTPAPGSSAVAHQITDDNFIFAIAVLRLAVPYTGLILTARENHELRSRAIQYGVSQIDGGTKLEIGGYAKEKQESGGAQFTLNDCRALSEVINELVDTDRIPSFCTACYRLGRTGEHFMEFSTKGFIKRFCTPNAMLTLAEYLEDYATPQLKIKGYALIEKEIAGLQIQDDKQPSSTTNQIEHRSVAPVNQTFVDELKAKLARIKAGERDLYF